MIVFIIINIVLSVAMVVLATAIFIIQRKEINILTNEKFELKQSKDYYIKQLRARSETDDE